jgi:hypothetical protein
MVKPIMTSRHHFGVQGVAQGVVQHRCRLAPAWPAPVLVLAERRGMLERVRLNDGQRISS